MKLFVVPGYKHLFGEPSRSYEEVLKDIPTDIVIRLIISLNKELNTSETRSEQQKRLINLISHRYTKEQNSFLEGAFSRFKRKVPHYEGTLFGRRYLLSMLLDELKRNHSCHSDIEDPIHEFDFLMAYLMAVDKVSEGDGCVLDKIKSANKDELGQLKIIWAGLVNQYEFNQTVNGAFEIFRLVCFLVYSYKTFRPFLKELVNINGFGNLSQFISSFYQLTNSTLNINVNEPLQKLNYISATEGVDLTHLKNQSINRLIGKERFSLSDIRKYPLYETDDRGFMIIDEDFYRKKLYKGPLFELYYETKLKKEMTFEDYKAQVSKDVYEQMCFQSIVYSLRKSKYDVINFDDNTQSLPDLYFRNNKTVILMEFKDYLFPDQIVEGDDFDRMKSYIDERFISSDREKKKGVSQLANHVSNLCQKTYEFDSELVHLLKTNKRIGIYAIICYSDFMFSVPGINEYLDSAFTKMVAEKEIQNCSISQITLIGLETLFDFTYRGGHFGDLIALIDRYWKIISNRKDKFNKDGSMDTFLSSKVSFDEIYETIFKKELPQISISSQLTKADVMTDGSGITQEILDDIL